MQKLGACVASSLFGSLVAGPLIGDGLIGAMVGSVLWLLIETSVATGLTTARRRSHRPTPPQHTRMGALTRLAAVAVAGTALAIALAYGLAAMADVDLAALRPEGEEISRGAVAFAIIFLVAVTGLLALWLYKTMRYLADGWWAASLLSALAFGSSAAASEVFVDWVYDEPSAFGRWLLFLVFTLQAAVINPVFWLYRAVRRRGKLQSPEVG